MFFTKHTLIHCIKHCPQHFNTHCLHLFLRRKPHKEIGPVSPHIIIDKGIFFLCIRPHLMKSFCLCQRNNTVSCQFYTISPFHIIPVYKIVFRHYPNTILFHRICPYHNGAGRHSVTFNHIRQTAIF